MPKQKKTTKEYKPLPVGEMHVADGGDSLLVGGQRFKRVVLPSVVAPSAKQAKTEEEQLLEELEADE